MRLFSFSMRFTSTSWSVLYFRHWGARGFEKSVWRGGVGVGAGRAALLCSAAQRAAVGDQVAAPRAIRGRSCGSGP